MAIVGNFVPKSEKSVTVWEPPDANGDGAPVYVTDEFGNRSEKTDSQGRTIKRYLPPERFENVPSINEHGQHTAENYVKKEGGQVLRDRNGNPLAVPEGGAAVVHPDGTFESIPPAKLREFLDSHTQV